MCSSDLLGNKVVLDTLLLLALSTVIIKGQDTPNEPFLSKQWYLQNEQEHSLNAYQDADIDGVEAWEFSTDHPNMKITIIKGQEGVADKLNPELVSSISTKNTEISKGIIVGIWGGLSYRKIIQRQILVLGVGCL